MEFDMAIRSLSDDERSLVDVAQRVLPGGTFGNMANETVIRAGRAGRVWDVSGNEYVDFLLSSGPMLVGHAHPEVNQAVIAQVERGSSFFANNEHGILLAAAIVDAVPCADRSVSPVPARKRMPMPCASPAPSASAARFSSSKAATMA
jgi:glutamate-1-semialdehyde aminotransferase